MAVFALFIPSAVLTLLSALSFLFLRRGWLLAAIAQGMSLAVCLWLYSWFQPGYVYPIMAYCVLMIPTSTPRTCGWCSAPDRAPQASHEN